MKVALFMFVVIFWTTVIISSSLFGAQLSDKLIDDYLTEYNDYTGFDLIINIMGFNIVSDYIYVSIFFWVMNISTVFVAILIFRGV